MYAFDVGDSTGKKMDIVSNKTLKHENKYVQVFRRPVDSEKRFPDEVGDGRLVFARPADVRCVLFGRGQNVACEDEDLVRARFWVL